MAGEGVPLKQEPILCGILLFDKGASGEGLCDTPRALEDGNRMLEDRMLITVTLARQIMAETLLGPRSGGPRWPVVRNSSGGHSRQTSSLICRTCSSQTACASSASGSARIYRREARSWGGARAAVQARPRLSPRAAATARRHADSFAKAVLLGVAAVLCAAHPCAAFTPSTSVGRLHATRGFRATVPSAFGTVFRARTVMPANTRMLAAPRSRLPERSVDVMCKCGTRLFKYKKGGNGSLVKCYVERIVTDFRTEEDQASGELRCPSCGNQFARHALVHGRPAYKMIGGKVTQKK